MHFVRRWSHCRKQSWKSFSGWLSAAPDSCHSFFGQEYTTDTTTSSAARERTNHLVCGSCKRELVHVQTCLGTWVCLTQHPSDMLRPFPELTVGPCMSLNIHCPCKSILSQVSSVRKWLATLPCFNYCFPSHHPQHPLSSFADTGSKLSDIWLRKYDLSRIHWSGSLNI
jgi:hypothetical protein